MSTRRLRLGTALVIPALGIPFAAQRAEAYTPPPPPTRQLPSALDVAVPYQGQTICDPVARPGVLAFAKLMVSHYGMGSTALIGRTCGSDVSEHYDGRAWDWMLNVNNPAQEAVAQSVLKWLTAPDAQGRPGAMARRFGIMYIIHNRKMWRAYAPERGWAPYYGVSPHTDHIHFSFTYDGAAKRTSWWTGVATKTYLTSLPPATPDSTVTIPAPTTYTTLSYGMTSEAVRRLQARLGNLPTTAWYGPMTQARVRAYQSFMGLPVTGVADVRTQQLLFTKGWTKPTPTYTTLRYGMTSEAVRRLQARLGNLPTTAWYGPMTQARVRAYQSFMGLPVTGVADVRTQQLLFTKGWTKPTPTYTTLRYGMTSEAVRRLQAKLGNLPTTGYFGSMTQARVREYQKFRGLPVTGVADVRTQELLFTKGWATAAPAAYIEPRAGGGTAAPAAPAAQAFAVLRQPATSAAVATVSTATAYTPYKDVVLAPGARGGTVRFLQRALGGLAVDGVYGPLTRRAVAALQVAEGVAVTGVVTPEVWDVLEAREFPFVAHRGTVLRPGDTGPAVAAVQRVLGVPVTSVYDADTRAAVKVAQARAGLASTGVVASRTWSLFDRLSA